MSSVNVRNCIRFYQTAEELDATTLMNYCGEIIASHWVSDAACQGCLCESSRKLCRGGQGHVYEPRGWAIQHCLHAPLVFYDLEMRFIALHFITAHSFFQNVS